MLTTGTGENTLAASSASARVQRVIEPPIDRINRARKALEAGGVEVLDLGQAIPDFGPPPAVVEALEALSTDAQSHRYTPGAGIAPLREAVATQLRDQFAVANASAEEILITGGANHAFLVSCLALLGEGDCVGLLSPYFLNHRMAIEGCGAAVVEILPESDFSYAPSKIARKIKEHDLRALVLVNPSNPTGKVFTKDELTSLLSACREAGVWLIADEVYRCFVDGSPPMTSIGALPGAEEMTITIGSFSKELCLTGWRVGWLRAPNGLMDQLLKVQDYSIICAPRASQLLALAGVHHAPNWAPEQYADLLRRRQVFTVPLQKSEAFQMYAGQGGFFLWFRPRREVDSEIEVFQLMERSRVCLVPGSAFGDHWRGWFRASYGSQSTEKLHQASLRLVGHFESGTRR